MSKGLVRLGIIVAAFTLVGAGCDALGGEAKPTAANTPRVKPMKLTTDPPGVAVSLYGDSLGLTPIILDSNKVEWPVTFRVFFEEGQREFTFEEYELERELTFEDGEVPPDIAVREKAREDRAREEALKKEQGAKKGRREKGGSKLEVNELEGAEHVNPYKTGSRRYRSNSRRYRRK